MYTFFSPLYPIIIFYPLVCFHVARASFLWLLSFTHIYHINLKSLPRRGHCHWLTFPPRLQFDLWPRTLRRVSVLMCVFHRLPVSCVRATATTARCCPTACCTHPVSVCACMHVCVVTASENWGEGETRLCYMKVLDSFVWYINIKSTTHFRSILV